MVERKRTSSSARSTSSKPAPLPEVDEAASIPDAVTEDHRLPIERKAEA